MTGLDYRVSSLRDMAVAAAESGATACLSIGDPDTPCPPTPPGVIASRHLVLGFADLCKPGGRGGPSEGHIQAILEFMRGLRGGERVLVHCHAGISRSTAAAWIGDLDTRAAAGATIDLELFRICRHELAERRPVAVPNPIMMQLYLAHLHGNGLAADVDDRDLTGMRFAGLGSLDFDDEWTAVAGCPGSS
ncbi:hypothetical protein [Paracoccus sp. ME4]|uniref:hypothetical protein n=1 Tax=Paracoccus sp. ME4 TaxID=3138066 RepID=UPI00398AC926